jgi:hypothetical protein
MHEHGPKRRLRPATDCWFHATLGGVLSKVRSARASQLALTTLSGTLVAACSLFAPTDAELIGGGASPKSHTDAGRGNGGEETAAGAGLDAGASAGGVSVGGTAGQSTGTAGQSTGTAGQSTGTAGQSTGTAGQSAGTAGQSGGGQGGVGGAGSCVPDITSKAPKASSLLDDFADGAPGPKFRVDGDTETCAVESGGRVVIALPQPLSSTYFCYYETLNNYDLTCDSVVLKVPEVAGPTFGVQTYLYVGPDAAHRVMVVVENGAYLFSTDAVDFSSAGRYDPAFPWWRLREASVGGQRKVIFETSSDAVAWRQNYSVARPFALNDVKVAFGAGAYRAVSSSGTGAFACYNAPASCH